MEVEVDWERAAVRKEVSVPGFSVVGEVMYLSAPGYDGRIDLGLHKAVLSIDTTSPTQDVDYFLRVIYGVLIFRAGGLLLHGAGIIRHGNGYLFFGHSGSGKTTVSRLSRQAVVLNDDLVAVYPTLQGWEMAATPFWNPTQVAPTPQSGKLLALFRLVQDRRVYTERMSVAQGLAELVASTPIIPQIPGLNQALLERQAALLCETPVYFLHFLPDDSFWGAVEDVELK